MKAIRITQNGDASVLQVQSLPQPKPGNGEALVRLKAAGLNFIDIYMRTGRYPTELPSVLSHMKNTIKLEVAEDF